MQNITLYAYVTSPYAMKVHGYLLYKSLDFKVVFVNPLKVKKELPIGKQIPVLSIDQESRAESQDLGLWLDEQFPDTPKLVFGDDDTQTKILDTDNWIAQNLIVNMFASIYPRLNSNLPRAVASTMVLGRSVYRTTQSFMPPLIWCAWPAFIRATPFIRDMVAPFKSQDVNKIRQDILSYLDNLLKNNQFLAGTDLPSMADISACSLFMASQQLGLKGESDFMRYSNIARWYTDIEKELNHKKDGKNMPPFVPR